MGFVGFVIYFLVAVSLPSLIVLVRSGFVWKKSDFVLPVLIFVFYQIVFPNLGHSYFANAFYCWLLFTPVSFFRLHDGIDKKIPKAVKALTNFVGGKDNRTALAIAIGAIAIVLALLFSNNQPKNADNNKDSRPEVVRANKRHDHDSDYTYYFCPDGYRGDGGGWCYLK